jgi:hypothetical protein
VLSVLILPAAFARKPDQKLAVVIAGTVFREPGFALSGAAVELTEVRKDGKKSKTLRAVSDGRGEFAFRLSGVEARFRIKASAPGLQSEEKETTATPGVRTDVFFTLKPVSP